MSTFYAVYKGRKTGVYPNWESVNFLVSGYKGAIFQKFKTHAQAQHFVETGEIKKEMAQLQLKNELCIYTDGAFSSKTKRSGIGVAWDAPFIYHAFSKRIQDGSTNQLAEVYAIETALLMIDKTPEIKTFVVKNKAVIWTDSDYACRCLYDYIHKWRENGWVTNSGKTVKHRFLLQRCSRLLTKLRHVRIRHISEVGLHSHDTKASVKNAAALTKRVWAGNKRADELATEARL